MENEQSSDEITNINNENNTELNVNYDESERNQKREEKSNKPLDTGFRQQRLPAWRPILAPHNVIPILFCVGIIVIPLGILFLVSSNNIQEYIFNYTDCISNAPQEFTTIFQSSSVKNENFLWKKNGNICTIRFGILKEMKGPIFMYYKLTNYYQNNRLYAKSVSYKQMRGEDLSKSDLSDCDPLIHKTGSKKVYYPCGLVANSFFSDEFSPLKLISNDKRIEETLTVLSNRQPTKIIEFVPSGITWSSDEKRYQKTKYKLEQIAPPPFWRKNKRLVNSDGEYREIPKLWKNERFQVWMRVAALPTFRKLYGRYDFNINPGIYEIDIDSNYDVKSFGGTKSLVISTVSWIGGKNSFLGIAYLVVGGLCILIAILFLIKHLISPRKTGDIRFLSWNRQ